MSDSDDENDFESADEGDDGHESIESPKMTKIPDETTESTTHKLESSKDDSSDTSPPISPEFTKETHCQSNDLTFKTQTMSVSEIDDAAGEPLLGGEQRTVTDETYSGVEFIESDTNDRVVEHLEDSKVQEPPNECGNVSVVDCTQITTTDVQQDTKEYNDWSIGSEDPLPVAGDAISPGTDAQKEENDWSVGAEDPLPVADDTISPGTDVQQDTKEVNDWSIGSKDPLPVADDSISPGTDVQKETKEENDWSIGPDDVLAVADDTLSPGAENSYDDGGLELEECLSDGSVGESTEKTSATRKLERRSNSRERAVLDQLNRAAENRQAQSSWGSWGASLLATATSSVATFTNQVGQGISSVIEGVEAGLGAPSPEELAAHVRKVEKEAQAAHDLRDVGKSQTPESVPSKIESEQSHSSQTGLPLSMENIVSGVGMFTSAIEHASSKALSGGLDTLELIGRKTMDILQDGDPGLKKKRSFISARTPNLSDVLRQVKEKADADSGTVTGNDCDKQVHFGLIFDECQGLVHIEALEMLSKQCKQKVEAALMSFDEENVKQTQARLLKFKEACVWEGVDDADENTDQDLAALVEDCLANFNESGALSTDTFLKDQQGVRDWLKTSQTEQQKGEQRDPHELHTKAITCLATFTAQAIKLIHKICEVTLLSQDVEALEEISSFSRLVNAFCLEVAIQSAQFSACLNIAADDSENPDDITPLITNVYLEASNCNTYLQDAFDLVVPIFQLKDINKIQT